MSSLNERISAFAFCLALRYSEFLSNGNSKTQERFQIGSSLKLSCYSATRDRIETTAYVVEAARRFRIRQH
jgi:hypothetical protein